MFFTILPLVAALVVFLRLILPARPGRLCLTAISAVLLLASQKYAVYKLTGGSFFEPDLPDAVLYPGEWLYAALILLFMLTIVKDAAWLIVRMLRPRLHTLPVFSHLCHLFEARRITAALLGVTALLGAASGLMNACALPTVLRTDITVPHLDPRHDGLTIALLADLHIGPLRHASWTRAVVDRTNALGADLVAIAGDFVDGQPARAAQDLAPLHDLQAPLGVWGCPGNHEYYSGIRSWLPYLKSFGVRMLLNEHAVIEAHGAPLVIAGVEDAKTVALSGHGDDAEKALAHAPAGTAKILLSHRPGNARAHAAAGADLQLSGHTHGGVMCFLKPLIAGFNNGLVSGTYAVDGMPVHVSNGTGIWMGFAQRIGVPSEITLITLHSPPEAGSSDLPSAAGCQHPPINPETPLQHTEQSHEHRAS